MSARPLLLAPLALAAAFGCRKAEAPTPHPPAASVRLYVLSTAAGALEPCGCRKDMLGGIAHAAALIANGHAQAPQHLVLGAGPLLFQDPELDRERGDQDLWKAEALADSFADLGLAAWAPGANDFAAGVPRLGELVGRSHAKLLGANLGAAAGGTGPALPVTATASYQVGGYRVGVAGIAAPPATLAASDPVAALAAAEHALVASGAQIRVALISATRGDALRLVEKVPGFTVALLGKPTENGDANDAPPPPTLIGNTLIVETSNHLQTLGYVDLFVKGDDFAFRDGMDLEQSERRESLQRRMAEIDQRLSRWQSQSPVPSEQIALGQQQRAALEGDLARLNATKTAAQNAMGSFFRYQVAEVREKAGSDPSVVNVTAAYYRRVNEHNREAFRDRVPEPAPAGTSHYVGEAACASCHAEADAFWKTMKHAHAYQTLASQFKEFNLDCVGCHVTGYNRPGGSTVTHVDALKDVQCEACHGPGSRHVESAGDTALIQRKPDSSVCRSCHRSPHVADDWNAEQAVKLILGPGHGAPPAAR